MTRPIETLFWTGLMALAVAVGLTLIPTEVLAQALPTDKVDQKFEDLAVMVKQIAWGIAGFVVVGTAVRMMTGNTDAWALGLKLLMGTLLLYLSPDIIAWMKS